MIKFLINGIYNALGFSKTESRGVLILILVMGVSIAISQFYVHSLRRNNNLTPENVEALRMWVAEVESSYERKKEVEFDKSVFLPVSKPYLSSKKETKKWKPKPKPMVEKEIEIVDINAANEEDLMQIRGIGPSYSRRIIKFRDLLGGFTSMDQLQEVYGLPSETVDELSSHLTIATPPMKIKINSDSAKVLARHPYITFDLAWVIINYRKQNGDIGSSEDLKKIKALDEKTFLQLRPYID